MRKQLLSSVFAIQIYQSRFQVHVEKIVFVYFNLFIQKILYYALDGKHFEILSIGSIKENPINKLSRSSTLNTTGSFLPSLGQFL
jgi:hypothetical protein